MCHLRVTLPSEIFVSFGFKPIHVASIYTINRYTVPFIYRPVFRSFIVLSNIHSSRKIGTNPARISWCSRVDDVRRRSGHINREQTGITRNAGRMEGDVQETWTENEPGEDRSDVGWTAERGIEHQQQVEGKAIKQGDGFVYQGGMVTENGCSETSGISGRECTKEDRRSHDAQKYIHKVERERSENVFNACMILRRWH